MRTILIYMVMAFLCLGNATAQEEIKKILTDVEANNTTLKALRDEYEAQKLLNKTGITLDDPEIEFAYLWGSPKEISNRKDFSVSQRFDLATMLGRKEKVAESRNSLLNLQYKQERMELLLEAKKALIELTYTNAMRKATETRSLLATELLEAYRKKMERGDANALETNKVEMNLVAVKGELQRLNIEREALLKNLQRLNGGKAVDYNSTTYATQWNSLNFEDWYAQAETKNPVLNYVQKEIQMNQENIKLNKSMNLPSISVGYSSELVTGQNYRGATIGLSIPLWSSKNRVKQARAALQASESKMQDAKQQFYSQLAIQYERTRGLQQTASEFKSSLEKLNNSALLQKALDAGQISLLDYLVEIGLYYDSVGQALLAERDFQIALAELQAVEL